MFVSTNRFSNPRYRLNDHNVKAFVSIEYLCTEPFISHHLLYIDKVLKQPKQNRTTITNDDVLRILKFKIFIFYFSYF